MIALLRGRVLETDPDRLIVDVGGVGYELHVSASTVHELAARPEGDEVTFRVHTHVREDALQLFGFLNGREKALFLRLVAVSGIGPRLALTVLSGMTVDDLIAAIRGGDARRLQSISGVGKAIAGRMANELREKLDDLAIAPAGPTAGRPIAGDDDLVLALENLGYKRVQAEAAIRRLDPDAADAPFADRLRATLRLLSNA